MLRNVKVEVDVFLLTFVNLLLTFANISGDFGAPKKMVTFVSP